MLKILTKFLFKFFYIKKKIYNLFFLTKNDLQKISNIIINEEYRNYEKFNFVFKNKIISKKLYNFFIFFKKLKNKNRNIFSTKINYLKPFIKKSIKIDNLNKKLNKKINNLLKFNTIISFFFNLKLIKFFFFNLNVKTVFLLLQKNLKIYINNFYFYSFNFNIFFFNIYKNNKFLLKIKKKIIKIFTYKKFDVISINWYNNSLLRFLENCSGKKILLKTFMFLNNNLNLNELILCINWSQKLKNFQKTIGPGLFVLESIKIIYISLKLKDVYLLINWMQQTLTKINFWKHRLFFHFLKHLFKYFFWTIFTELKIKGLKFKLKGKISVAGNARTRTITYQIGFISYATYNNKILTSIELIRTFTGVLGLQIWLVF